MPISSWLCVATLLVEALMMQPTMWAPVALLVQAVLVLGVRWAARREVERAGSRGGN